MSGLFAGELVSSAIGSVLVRTVDLIREETVSDAADNARHEGGGRVGEKGQRWRQRQSRKAQSRMKERS